MWNKGRGVAGSKPIGYKSPKAKLSYDQVIEIKKLLSNGLVSRKIANMFNVEKTTILRIKNGTGYTNVGGVV